MPADRPRMKVLMNEYKWTLRYLTVMVTLTFLLLLFDPFIR